MAVRTGAHPRIKSEGMLRSKTLLRQSGLTLGGHHDPNQIGGVTRAKLLHDIGAMILDGARADPEMASRFLVGCTRGELLQHLALASRQRFAPRKMQRRNPRCGIFS